MPLIKWAFHKSSKNEGPKKLSEFEEVVELLKRSKTTPFIIVAVLAIGGLLFMQSSRAATFEVASEAETGTLQGNATKNSSDAGASGGASVSFSTGTGTGSGKTGGCIAPAGLQPTDLDAAHGGTDQIPPWPHTYGDAAVIYYSTNGLPTEYADYIKDGAAVWNASPCVDIKVVDQCPATTNCVKGILSTTKLPDSDTTDGRFDGYGTDTYLTDGTITFVQPLLDQESAAYKRLVVTHEMGHSVSLGHRLTQTDIMYWASDESAPLTADATNLNNILAVYGVQSEATQVSPGVEGAQDKAARKPVVTVDHDKK